MKKFWILGAFLCSALLVRHFQRDTFFSNIGLDVPQSAIISHQNSGWLMDVTDHLLVLDIPANQWPAVLA